jgi:hypothetical protein
VNPLFTGGINLPIPSAKPISAVLKRDGYRFAPPILQAPLPRIVIPRASGVSSTLRLFDSIFGFSGILDRPPEPVIGLAEGETRWRAMTAERVARFRRRATASAQARRAKAEGATAQPGAAPWVAV